MMFLGMVTDGCVRKHNIVNIIFCVLDYNHVLQGMNDFILRVLLMMFLFIS